MFSFFRDPTVYEILRSKGLASDTRFFSPKLPRDMKFVAHDATVVRDFLENFGLYVQTLEEYINSSSSTEENRGKAKGFLLLMKNEKTLMDVKFLAGITRLLKRFSTEFQVRKRRGYRLCLMFVPMTNSHIVNL